MSNILFDSIFTNYKEYGHLVHLTPISFNYNFIFRLPNEHSCKPICKQKKRKHTLRHHEHINKIEHQVELQDESHRNLSLLENSRIHSRKKLPSFMATKLEEKMLPFK